MIIGVAAPLRHMIGFQAAFARCGIELGLGKWLALGFQERKKWHWHRGANCRRNYAIAAVFPYSHSIV